MFIHLNYASNYASQCQHCGVSRWQDMKAMPVTLFLPPSLSLAHIFGTIIPLFNRVVWSCFTPLHPHWLLFCPISPFLIRLCVINNDRQKMGVHIGAPYATVMPVIRFNTNNLIPTNSTFQPSYHVLFPCCQHSATQERWAPIHSDWRATLHNGPVLHICRASQKRDHTTVELWKVVWIKRSRVQREHS